MRTHEERVGALHFVTCPPRCGIAELKLIGTITPDKLKRFRARLAAAERLDDATAILVTIDSPGGSIEGVEQTARAVHASACRRPLVVWSRDALCSAAYWIASGASRIVTAPGCRVGAVGIRSGASARTATKQTDWTATVAENEGEWSIRQNHRQMIGCISAGRQVAPGYVRSWRNDQPIDAETATARGMIDGIEANYDALFWAIAHDPQAFRRRPRAGRGGRV